MPRANAPPRHPEEAPHPVPRPRAAQGSCAVGAYVDLLTQTVTVGNIGDSRAVTHSPLPPRPSPPRGRLVRAFGRPCGCSEHAPGWTWVWHACGYQYLACS